MGHLKQIKLVQISASLNPMLGGPAKVVEDTSNIFVNYFDASLIVFGHVMHSNQKSITVPTILNNRYGWTWRTPQKSIRKKIIEADILLIHGFYLYSTILAIFLSKSKKIYIMPHGSLEDYQEQRGRLRKIIFRIVLRTIGKNSLFHFIVGSHTEMESVRKVFPNAKVSVVGLGVRNSDSKLYEESKLHNPIKLYCISRIVHKKRIDLSIKTLQKLNLSGPIFELSIIGNGDNFLELELKKLVSELGLGNQVKFHGFLEGSKKQKVIEECDIFLLNSENENFAIAVAEAIVLGKPVVVSSYVAMHDFVDKYSVGETASDLTVDAISKSILNVVNNYDKMRNNCVQYAPLLYWNNVIMNWIEIISEDF